tara:strand:- start:207 stop:410 length:204 start_codon:yes stop_codon:yes gene_type:complete
MPIADKKYIKRRRKKPSPRQKIQTPVAVEMPFSTAAGAFDPFHECPPPPPYRDFKDWYKNCRAELGI